ncbi:MAG: hypothetical protein H6765_04320 [Candidatus Peribacteria bacterium]|nr:MAG: hypothetical protein H6765_04320 [Candidatus Peribacteria bacterium]
MKCKTFAIIMAMILFGACGKDAIKIDPVLAPSLTNYTVDPTNWTARLTVDLEVFKGTDEVLIGFKSEVRKINGDLVQVNFTKVQGFQHQWQMTGNGASLDFYELEGQDSLQVDITFKNPLESLTNYNVTIYVLDQELHQLTARTYSFQSNFIQGSPCNVNLSQQPGQAITTATSITDKLNVTAIGCGPVKFVVSSPQFAVTGFQLQSLQTAFIWGNNTLGGLIGTVNLQLQVNGNVPANTQVSLTVTALDAQGNLLGSLTLVGYSYVTTPPCTTLLAGGQNGLIIGQTEVSFNSSFSQWGATCPVELRLFVNGQQINSWTVVGGNVTWTPAALFAPTGANFTVHIPQSQLSQGSQQVTWRIYDASSGLLSSKSFTFNNVTGGNDCRIISLNQQSLQVTGNQAVLTVRMLTEDCQLSHKIIVDWVNILSANVQFSGVAVSAPDSPGANFLLGQAGSWSVNLTTVTATTGYADFIISLSKATPFVVGDKVAFHISEWDNATISTLDVTLL